MITYKDILNDKKVINEYKKIDAQNVFPFSHGLQHIKNVVKIMGKITDTLNITGNRKQYLLIACALHDIGQTNGRENHGLKAKLFSKEYLKNEIPKTDLNLILSAIEKHDQETQLDKLSLFTNLVCFADKMDFSKKRLEKNYEKKFGHLVYDDIVDINFEYIDNCFKVKITTNGIDNAKQLLEQRNFFHKVINSSVSMSKKLKASCKILVDKDEIDINQHI